MKLTENSIHVLNQRYLLKDINGNIVETPEQLFERVANAICENETPEFRNRILDRLLNLDFLPNSPTLMNSGTEMSQLSACFVLPIEDSLNSIFNGVKNTALIFQTGGGVGASFGKIRPKNSPVKSTQGIASGPISFMQVYNTATEVVKQGGKRRGAFMSVLPVSHPDIFDFINIKNKGDTLNNMNLSVMCSDEFMEAVVNNKDWNLTFNNKIYKTLPAKNIFNTIIKHAHESGDPGLLFYDTINEGKIWNEKIESTNPCAETPILPYESCNLASIKLSNFVKEDKQKSFIDYDSLKECVKDVIKFLDLVIDKNKYPLPEIEQKTKETRKIGLGIMAWADTLVLLNISYTSQKAIELADKVMSFISHISYETSTELAKEKGEYPLFNDNLNNIYKLSPIDIIPIRNSQLLAIAPTGTISIIANCSSGIEPIYAVAYKRNLKSSIGKDLYEVNPLFMKIMKENNFNLEYLEQLIEKIIHNKGSIQNIKEIPNDIKKLFLTAHDISYENHIRMQSVFQKHIDGGCSKTINMPNDATQQQVYDAYILAWRMKCKGITVYIDGSKDHQVLITDSSQTLSTQSTQLTPPTPRIRYKDHIGIIREIENGCGSFYNIISFDEYGIFEDFIIDGIGGCTASEDSQGRSTSTLLRYNIPPEVIIEQFKRVKRCTGCINNPKIKIKSCADGIGKHIEDYYINKELIIELIKTQKKIHNKYNNVKPIDNLSKDAKKFQHNFDITQNTNQNIYIICQNCGSTNIDPGKCRTCHDCGFSKCI